MQQQDIKEILLKIQLFLAQGKHDNALRLYNELEKNWNFYTKQISSLEEKEELLKLVDHIHQILQKKHSQLLEKKKYFLLREKYSKY